MSFRDDFNTLDTDKWEVYSTLPSSSVDIYNGHLRFRLVMDLDEKGIIGLRYKSRLDLRGKKVTFTPKFVRDSSYIHSWLGIAVTNYPFDWYNRNPQAMRGFTFWLAGSGNINRFCAAWQLLGGNIFRPAEFECIEYPPLMNCRVGNNGIYIYVGDTLLDYKMVTFDLSQAYLQLCAPAFAIDTDTTEVLVDYIEVAPTDVPETQPDIKQGSTLEMPLFPPGTIPSIFSALMLPIIGNALVGLAERVKPRR